MRINGRALSWALFDFGTSAHNTIITTFIFSVYFAKQVAGDEITGTALWGQMMVWAALAVAVVCPMLAFYAERARQVQFALRVLTPLLCLFTAALFFVMPGENNLCWPLLLAGTGILIFECMNSLYSAQLRDVSADEKLGRMSGLGWAAGYVGGILALAIALFVFIQPKPPLFGLDAVLAEPVRVTLLLAAAWILIFSLPHLMMRERDIVTAEPLSFAAGWQLLQSALQRRELLQFFIASALYRDGLNTLFAFGGIYAATVHGFSFQQVIIFAIALNVTAAIGAAAFGFLDDKLGSRSTIIVSLLGLILCGAAVLLSSNITLFWIAALALGIFVGPVQAASRSYLTRITAPNEMQSMFGLYNTTGKAAAFLGPLLYAAALQFTGAQQGGMAMVVVMWVLGLLVLTARRAGRIAGG